MQNSIPASLDALKNETSQLISALRAPKTRGNWGELQLKRCVEYAGMVEYCSFSEQTSARTEDDRLLRPDMTIQLPNGRTIIVDAKTPLDAFLDAGESADPAAQTLRFDAHAERVKRTCASYPARPTGSSSSTRPSSSSVSCPARRCSARLLKPIRRSSNSARRPTWSWPRQRR